MDIECKEPLKVLPNHLRIEDIECFECGETIRTADQCTVLENIFYMHSKCFDSASNPMKEIFPLSNHSRKVTKAPNEEGKGATQAPTTSNKNKLPAKLSMFGRVSRFIQNNPFWVAGLVVATGGLLYASIGTVGTYCIQENEKIRYCVDNVLKGAFPGDAFREFVKTSVEVYVPSNKLVTKTLEAIQGNQTIFMNSYTKLFAENVFKYFLW